MEELIRVVVKLGEVKEVIEIRKEDSPKELAEAFCIKHGLNQSQQQKLFLKISEKLDEFLMEQHAEELGKNKGMYGCNMMTEEISEKSEEDDSQTSAQEPNQSNKFNISYISHTAERQIANTFTKPITPIKKSSPHTWGSSAKRGGHSAVRLTNKMSNSFDKEAYNSKTLYRKAVSKSTIFNESNNQKYHRRIASDRKTKKDRFEILYQLASLQKTKREKMAQGMKELREKEEMKQVTFRPKIIHRKKDTTSFNIPIHDRLHEYKVMAKQRLKLAKIEFTNEMQKECTFRPQINKKLFVSLLSRSEKMMENYNRARRWNKLDMRMIKSNNKYAARNLKAEGIQKSNTNYNVP